MQKNDTAVVTIEDIGVNGEGIGKVDGYTLFIKEYHNNADKPVYFHLPGAFPDFLIHYRLLPYRCQQLQDIIKKQTKQSALQKITLQKWRILCLQCMFMFLTR